MKVIKLEDAMKDKSFRHIIQYNNLRKFMNFIEFRSENAGECVRYTITIKSSPIR